MKYIRTHQQFINYKKSEDINEGFKDKFKNIAAATAIAAASGMSSCQGFLPGFGYNISFKKTKYPIEQGEPNKNIEIFTPDGYKTYSVDSTLAEVDDTYSTQAIIFTRPITRTEAYILKVGEAELYELTLNDGNEYDAGINITNIDPSLAEIERVKHYDNNGASYDCRKSESFIAGLQKLQRDGVDIYALLDKADDEVKNEKWLE